MSASLKEHRGRIQAQGEGLEASENWAQDDPLTAEDGRTLLDKLKAKISKSEARKRTAEFDKAKDLIDRAEQQGGIHAHYGKSFRKSKSSVRVDIEVLGGTAFICVVLGLIIWIFFK